MKFAKSANHTSFSESYLNKDASKDTKVTPSFKEERLAKEQAAVEHTQFRTAQAEKFPKVATSLEVKPIHKAESTDRDVIVEEASAALKKHIGSLVGRGGFTIHSEEFRSRKAHKDIISEANVTDDALMSFAVDFTIPGLNKTKTAKFVVSFDEGSDNQFKVENVFYDVANKEHPLNSTSLENFLSNTETEMKTAEKVLVWYNPEAENYEAVEVKSAALKVAARLQSNGYAIEDNFWVDATHNPAKFGRLCIRVDVPVDRINEFKKIASMSDDEWVNRAADGKKPYNGEYIDRTLEKGKSESKSYKSSDEWKDRTLDNGPENPYGSEAKILLNGSKKTVEEVRAEAVKTAIASKDKSPESTLEKINNLDNLLK